MTSVRTTQRSAPGFRFFTILFLLIIALALDTPIARAESPLGSVSSDKKPLSRPSVVTMLTRGVPTTPTQAQSGSVAGVGGVCQQYYPFGQHQIDDPGDLWHSLLPSGDQPTLQLTFQRKNAQATISRQNPAPMKTVL
ncbi:MAG TPA: hypothetical protein VK901_00510 [Nitrospiraceae bacterium]|nr:hypothetical protein [Nitrospiraceae bacterium]